MAATPSPPKPGPTPAAARGVGIMLLGPILAGLMLFLSPIKHELREPFTRVRTPDFALLEHAYMRKTVRIPSVEGALMLEAWQYEPKDWQRTGGPPPIIILAHGMGGQRDFGLHATADYFARAGAAVIVFDYRTFGGSDGEPRHWVSPTRHLEDWRSVIAYATDKDSHKPWDTSKLVLWGTSYSGGHVLTLAAELGDKVTAVVSQVPHLSAAAGARASLETRGVLPSLRLLLVGWADTVLYKLGINFPLYFPLAGPHGNMVMMALSPEEYHAWGAKHPKDKLGGWRNQMLARSAIEAAGYSPIKYLDQITAPVFIMAAEHDTLCPTHLIVKAALQLGSQPVVYPVDHFGLYLKATFQDAVRKQWAFICTHAKLDCSQGVVPNAPELPVEAADTADAAGAASTGGEGVAAAEPVVEAETVTAAA